MVVPVWPIAIGLGAAAAFVARKAWKRRRHDDTCQNWVCTRSEVEDLLADNHETERFGKWKCDCDKTRPTKNLYVIKLRPVVWEQEAKFRSRNRNRHKTGIPCVYVGESVHKPICRLAQHLKPHYRPTFVTSYGTCLMPREYERGCPVPADQAKRREEELAKKLQRRGWAVWWG